MSCFVDTSAFLAVLGKDDENHSKARTVWGELLEERAPLVTSNYVLVETLAILQHRMGLDAVHLFHTDVYPILEVEWVADGLHEKGMGSVLTARRRNLSLVDCVSFEVMRQRDIRKVFAFDAHFKEQGFEVRP